jgi:thioredoxin reductase (NADPH)
LSGRRSTVRDELLVDVGAKDVPFFVVLTGEIEAVRAFDGTETLNSSLRAGQFSGESGLISGRRSMARLRVAESGEVIELPRGRSLARLPSRLNALVRFSVRERARESISKACCFGAPLYPC